jgi:iron complex transport system substrate-binding protein
LNVLRQGSQLRTIIAAVALFCGLHCLDAAHASPPARVVSMNVCTDQLAMLTAAEGQLHSVSYLASDPGGSVMPEEAKRYAVNHGLAEEIFVMKPDLVLAGTFTSDAAVTLLKRLGLRVEQFPPSYSFAEIRDQIKQMGALLGRQARAAELVADLDARLAGATPQHREDRRKLAALYYANNYTSGENTLAAEVVETAGLRNLGTELGYTGTVRVPLEALVMAAPDLIIGEPENARNPAYAFDAFRHPALRAVVKGRELTHVPDKYWICGAPFTALAVEILTRRPLQ